MRDDRVPFTIEVADGQLRITHPQGWCVGRLPEPSEFGVCLRVGHDVIGTVGGDADSVGVLASDGMLTRCDLATIAGTTAKSFHAVITGPVTPITFIAMGADDVETFRHAYPSESATGI